MIISLSGLKGSGKTTVSNYLQEYHLFQELSFASTLKDVVASMFNFDRDILEGANEYTRSKREEIDPWWSEKLGIPDFSMRKALTHIGTDILRNKFNDNIWIYAIERKLMHILESNPYSNIVISDTRFVAERNFLSKFNTKFVLIKRGLSPDWYNSAFIYNLADPLDKEHIKSQMLNEDPADNPNIFNLNIHASEYEHIGLKYDYVLYNIDFEPLYLDIDQIVQTHLGE